MTTLKAPATFLGARELIGAPVVDANGKTLGHVIDLEVDPERRFRVSAIELGRFGWLDRLHLFRPITRGRTSRPLRIVDWRDVDGLERRKLILRAGAKVRDQVPTEEEPPQQRTASGG